MTFVIPTRTDLFGYDIKVVAKGVCIVGIGWSFFALFWYFFAWYGFYSIGGFGLVFSYAFALFGLINERHGFLVIAEIILAINILFQMFWMVLFFFLMIVSHFSFLHFMFSGIFLITIAYTIFALFILHSARIYIKQHGSTNATYPPPSNTYPPPPNNQTQPPPAQQY